LRLAVAALMVVGISAAFVAPAGAGAEGNLKVVTSLPAPGFWGDSLDAKPADINSGFEYDLAQALAQKLGYTGMTLKNVSFDALVAGNVKNYDVALSQVSITPERKKVVTFSRPYFRSDQGILVKTGTTVDESNAKSIQWGVQTATTAQTFLNKELKPDKKPRSYQETTQAFTALQAGQVDAVMLDTAIVLAQAALSDGELTVVGQYDNPDNYGIIMPKGTDLKKLINQALKDLEADGTIANLARENLTQAPEDIPFLEL
jgi:polar amino acid transport system substrate-binding protein